MTAHAYEPRVRLVRCRDGRFALSLQRDGHTYGLIFDAATQAEALRTLGRWATTPDLCFTWYDAACASQAIRRYAMECAGK